MEITTIHIYKSILFTFIFMKISKIHLDLPINFVVRYQSPLIRGIGACDPTIFFSQSWFSSVGDSASVRNGLFPPPSDFRNLRLDARTCLASRKSSSLVKDFGYPTSDRCRSMLLKHTNERNLLTNTYKLHI